MFGISPKFNTWEQDECLVSQGFLSTARCPSPSFSELVSSDRVTGPLGTRASTSVCGGRAVPVLPFVVPRAGFDELVLGWAGLSVAHRGHSSLAALFHPSLLLQGHVWAQGRLPGEPGGNLEAVQRKEALRH